MTGLTMLITAALLIAVPAAGDVETVLIEADRDTTLIEDPAGSLGNGSGPVFFVGRTNQLENSRRRGLVRFDVAGSVPAGAVVVGASLTVHLPSGNEAVRQIHLHRVLADWGEGSSYATGGSGDQAAPGDATWRHTFYDDDFWVMAGGHFVPRASAETTVGGPGSYTWASGPHLASDVRLWLAAPRRNFGWIFIGDESTRQNVKSFSSREDPDPSLRPVLEVTYRRNGRGPD